MKNIRLINLNILNFKGIAKFNYDFNEKDANFISKSGIGKTSLLDAIKWTFAQTMNDIYPVINEKLIIDIPTKCSVTIKIDDLEYKFERESIQKLKSDKNNSGRTIFEGNSTVYIIDGATYGLKDFKTRLEEIFEIPYEDLIYLLDIKDFNNSEWKIQRKWLFEHCDVDKIIDELNNKYLLLKEDFEKKLDEADIQHQLNLEKKNNKQTQENNLKEMDKLNEELVALSKENYDLIEKDKDETNKKISDLLINSRQGQINTLVESKLKELDTLQKEYNKENNKIQEEIYKEQEKKNKLLQKINEIENDINFNERNILTIESQLNDLDISLEEIKEMVFDERTTKCSLCGQLLPEEEINKIKNTFENNKNQMEEECNNKIKDLNTKKLKSLELIKDLNKTLKEFKDKESSIKEIINDNSKTKELSSKIDKLKNEIKESQELFNEQNKKENDLIEKELLSLQNHYDECVRILVNKERKNDVIQRINELKDSNLELAERDKKRVQKQNELNNYINDKVNSISTTVNSYFEGVNFNFFNFNTDVAEKPFNLDCSVCFNGKDYQKQSTGERIISDILTQKGIQKILNINMFMFIDEIGSTSFDYRNYTQTITLLTLNILLEENGLKSNFNPTSIKDVYTENNCMKR